MTSEALAIVIAMLLVVVAVLQAYQLRDTRAEAALLRRLLEEETAWCEEWRRQAEAAEQQLEDVRSINRLLSRQCLSLVQLRISESSLRLLPQLVRHKRGGG